MEKVVRDRTRKDGYLSSDGCDIWFATIQSGASFLDNRTFEEGGKNISPCLVFAR